MVLGLKRIGLSQELEINLKITRIVETRTLRKEVLIRREVLIRKEIPREETAIKEIENNLKL